MKSMGNLVCSTYSYTIGTVSGPLSVVQFACDMHVLLHAKTKAIPKLKASNVSAPALALVQRYLAIRPLALQYSRLRAAH